MSGVTYLYDPGTQTELQPTGTTSTPTPAPVRCSPPGFLAVNADSSLSPGRGFIGGHLVDCLLKDGARVRAVDETARPLVAAASRRRESRPRLAGFAEFSHRPDRLAEVYNLAADMGSCDSSKQQSLLHVERPDQHAHADGGQGQRRETILLRLQRLFYAADKSGTTAPPG